MEPRIQVHYADFRATTRFEFEEREACLLLESTRFSGSLVARLLYIGLSLYN